MKFLDALNVLMNQPNAVLLCNNGRSDRDIQYTMDNGKFSWTCAFTVGGTVPTHELYEMKKQNSEGWAVYADLYSHTLLT